MFFSQHFFFFAINYEQSLQQAFFNRCSGLWWSLTSCSVFVNLDLTCTSFMYYKILYSAPPQWYYHSNVPSNFSHANADMSYYVRVETWNMICEVCYCKSEDFDLMAVLRRNNYTLTTVNYVWAMHTYRIPQLSSSSCLSVPRDNSRDTDMQRLYQPQSSFCHKIHNRLISCSWVNLPATAVIAVATFNSHLLQLVNTLIIIQHQVLIKIFEGPILSNFQLERSSENNQCFCCSAAGPGLHLFSSTNSAGVFF